MTCYKPKTAYWFREKGPNGKRPQLRFSPPPLADMDKYEILDIPCGQCIGCRLDHSREWALRCQHEASLHDQNCMVTLTYNNDYLPKDGELVPRDLTLFFKRLRKAIEPIKVRYFACGEYGTKNDRPHYHACIFGWSPDDKLYWQKTKAGSTIYRSALLEKLWPYGFSSVGDVTWQSAAYVARYNLKKQENSYANHRIKPFIRMSRRPGIGAEYAENHMADIYAIDRCGIYSTVHGCIVRTGDLRPPRFYDKMLEERDAALAETIKENRKENQRDPMYEYHQDSVTTKEAQVQFLKRNL